MAPKPKFAKMAANSVMTVAMAKCPKSAGVSRRANMAIEPTVTAVRKPMPRKVNAAPLTTRLPKLSAVGLNAFCV